MKSYAKAIYGLFVQEYVLPPKQEGVTRIIAVGDSITWGSCSTDIKTKAWPVQLMNMLHDTTKYEVINFGLGGRTMMKKGDMPYWNEPEYQKTLSSDADIIFLMLGTNDSKNYQWDEEAFLADYHEMAKNFMDIKSKPSLYLLVPPPLH